jgi:serine/threonine protein phosphatase PrpC
VGSRLLAVSAATDRGLVRRNNEDAILLGEWIGVGDTAAHEASFDFAGGFVQILICDGMGGHRGGAVASAAICEFLRTALPRQGGAIEITEALDEADRHLHLLMEGKPDLTAMGATVVGAVIGAETTIVFNVGDSRAYYFDGDRLQQISIDDTAPSEARTGTAPTRRNHAVTQALGGSRRRMRPRPHIVRLTPSAGHLLLLCSDGLTDMVTEDTIRNILLTPDAPAIDFIDRANEAGGEDNVSVVVATFTG